PEAASGGAIALVRDGDVISLDAASRSIHLDVSAERLDARRAAVGRPPPRFTSGVMSKYAHLVTSASDGAVTIVEERPREGQRAEGLGIGPREGQRAEGLGKGQGATV